MTATAREWTARLPSGPGVYRFRDGRGRVLYLGRAVDLRRRVGSYWRDLRGRQHLRVMVARVARIEAVECDSAHEAAWLERNLLEHTLPAWNRTRGGQEVPTYLRLDTRPTAPGLQAVHTVTAAAGVDHFGPYLGGDKARLAAAGLHRVRPLAYTGTGLTGAERDLADRLGIGTGDRGGYVEALTAILRRDPTAIGSVRRDMYAVRDRAAAALAFERAARVQEEIEAIEWITSPQRVTSLEPVDVEVSGWADGVLVRFQIQGGRVRTWTQRRCTAAGARRHLATTPAGWAEFARRSAALAARLAG